jgi:hypothetical protein
MKLESSSPATPDLALSDLGGEDLHQAWLQVSLL